MSKVTITNNPLVALRLGLPFRLCRLPDKGPQFGHGVYIPPGHLQRFMTMHAMSLIEDLEALAIRDEMMQEEVDRLRLSIDTRRATCGLSPRALVGHTEQSDIVGRVEVAMKFVKQSFMGIELDVLVGHPEHDLLFVATQVARAAGLKDPKSSVRQHAPKASAGVLRVSDVLGDNLSSMRPEGIHAPTWAKMYLFTEATMYDMLLRGHAPASEPFRKWVTEEVLPSIRKTGTYNIHESETKEAQQFAGEFAQLHSAISELTSEVLSLKGIIAGCQKPSL